MATRFLLGSFCLFFSILFFNGVFSELPTDQKSAIVELSNALHNQTSSLRWNPHTDPCSWAGVTCSGPSNSSVTGLSLSNLGLAGPSFLPLACKIESLESLDVSKNSLSEIPVGFFTNCGIIQGLKLLNFSYNRVSGSLPSFKGFSKLEYLDLSHNSFNGSIGFQLDVLVGLKSLNLSFNLFTGSIPINLGKFKSLEMLQLSGNLFSGSIPEELGDCNNLTSIDLSINKLSGNLPASLGELSKLEYLVVSSNKLSGSIPDFLANITTLQRFAANQNMFSGVIPSGVSKHVLNLDLSYNKLLSQIPIDLLSQPNLVHVDLSSNRLVGSIPAKLSQKLFRLRLGSNLLNGTISSLNFAEPQNLTYLELDNNSLSGLIPAELGSCQMLKLLSLAQNKFSGELPQELGNLKQLQVLRLQSNTFSGRIPTEITGLLNLSTLNISWNLLSGTIPSSIVSLKHLVYLHLQGNNLSGPIPDGIGNMSALTELQLGKNSLSGNIPLMPTTLQYALNLSHNLFEGPIPKSLQYLTELEILDLSNNKFDGEIPDFLTRMSSLTTLLLTDNDLSGVAPKFGPNVLLDTNGNLGLINGSTSSTSPVSAHKRTSVAVVVPVAVAAALAGAVVALVVILFTRRYYKVNDVTIQELDEIPPSRSVGGYMLSSSSSHRSNIDFTRAMEAVAGPLNIVLKTRFSTYYRVVMPSGTSYFVKKLNWSDKIFQLGSHENFGQELEALAKLSSSNIMTPLAYMLVSNGAYIFYEFAQKGSLFDVLHGSSETNLDWASRYSIAVGVAQGLAFLHGCSSGPILLLDLTSRNIMLKSLKEPQVGDIELCKVIDPSKSTSSLSALAGSVGYIPPEYAYTMRITMAGNVYSFGVILLELVTGKQAVSEGTELAKWVLSNSSQQLKWNHLLDFTVGKKSPAVRNQMVAVLKIALACVSVSSEARPKMKSVLRMLLNVR